MQTNKSYYEVIRKESFANNDVYDTFLNWISGEFDLYLQDEENDLQVFFPFGKFCIRRINNCKENIKVEINVKSKNLSLCNYISDKITAVQSHMKKI
ncbi:hypothetical protein [Dokdonia sp.]|uniref:hypothetical protein n=1 Tax=Dokdonia sp. TaxID=2024995 RepID=UPI003267E885